MFERYMITFETLKNPDLFINKVCSGDTAVSTSRWLFFLLGQKEKEINLYLNVNIQCLEEAKEVITDYFRKVPPQKKCANCFRWGR